MRDLSAKERFLIAVRREIPDVVPVAPLIHNRFANKILGRTGWKAVFEVHRMVGSIYFRGPLTTPYQFKVEWNGSWGECSQLIEEQGVHRTYVYTIKTPMGKLTSKVVSGVAPGDPLISKTTEYYIKSESDFDTYVAYLKEWLRRAEMDLTEIDEACRVIGEDGIPSLGQQSIFNNLGRAMGLYQLLTSLYRRPEKMRELVEMFRLIRNKQLEAFLESPSEVLFYDICWACDMSPSLFKEWVLPDLIETVKIVKAHKEKYVGFYHLGRVRAIMPLIMEAKPDFMETFETLGGDLSLREAKKLYGQKICLMGNFNPLVLVEESLEDVKKETLRCLEEGMEGGGYVLVTGDEVPADAKLENLKIMANTVARFGRYT